MQDEDSDCKAISDIDRRANDALNVIKAIKPHSVPKALELGLDRIQEDLDAIVMDNHHRYPGSTQQPRPGTRFTYTLPPSPAKTTATW